MMRDPHVVALYYRLETDSSLIFDHPPPLEHDTGAFTLHLADGMLTCTMKGHYTSAEEAKAVVRPLINDWERDFALSYGHHALRFTYQKADIIDRDPSPPGIIEVAHGSGSISAKADVQGFGYAPQRTYPAPPTRFIASPDVETLWRRYEGYKEEREPLLPMAYFCLSLLEWRANKRTGQGSVRKKIEREYGIAEKVVDTLGKLTTILGDTKTARKLHAQSAGRAPTPAEAGLD